jgi:hypothetical protein
MAKNEVIFPNCTTTLFYNLIKTKYSISLHLLELNSGTYFIFM